jgi:hypothetical protein
MLGFIVSKIFTGPFLITIARYALAALGTWLFANYGFDPGKWEAISGALLTIAMALWGGADSVTNKIVAGGQRVPLNDLPTLTQEQVIELVERETGKRPKIVPKP